MRAQCTATFFDGAVRAYRLESFADARGRLMPIDFAALPLAPARAFLVEAPDGAVRGGHAHRNGRQFLLRISGEISVECVLGGERRVVRLDAGGDNAVLISAPVWAQQMYHGDDARLLVLADTPYDPDSYIGGR